MSVQKEGGWDRLEPCSTPRSGHQGARCECSPKKSQRLPTWVGATGLPLLRQRGHHSSPVPHSPQGVYRQDAILSTGITKYAAPPQVAMIAIIQSAATIIMLAHPRKKAASLIVFLGFVSFIYNFLALLLDRSFPPPHATYLAKGANPPTEFHQLLVFQIVEDIVHRDAIDPESTLMAVHQELLARTPTGPLGIVVTVVHRDAVEADLEAYLGMVVEGAADTPCHPEQDCYQHQYQDGGARVQEEMECFSAHASSSLDFFTGFLHGLGHWDFPLERCLAGS